MKQNIHPDYHKITVKRTDGSSFETFSTWGKPGDTLQLDIDTLTHNAWVGGKTKVNDRAGNVAKFNQKFAGYSLASVSNKVGAPSTTDNTKKKVVKKDAKKEEAKKEEKKD